MKQNRSLVNRIWSVLVAIFIAVIGALPYILFRDKIQAVAGLGYIGLFLSCVLTNASVFLPASGIAFTLAAATALNPFLCAIIGGTGTATGELVGYIIGAFGRGSIANTNLLLKAEAGLKRFGYWAVLFFAFLPLPLFDFIGVAAGTAKIPIMKFYFACCVGKILKMLLYVFVFRVYFPL